MVEAQLEQSIPKTGAPGLVSFDYFSTLLHNRESNLDSVTPQEYPNSAVIFQDFYDSSGLATPTAHPNSAGEIDKDNDGVSDSMYGDASERMSESSKPDRAKAGTPNHRRRSRPQPGNTHRPPGQHSSQPPPTQGYVIASPSPSENVHSRPPAGFQGSPIHYSPTVPYSQRSGYVGQYTMSPQPNPMTMAHSPSPYGYPHTYHLPAGPADNSMNIHANYSNMLQPQAAAFSYQRPSPDGSVTSHHSFSGVRSSPIYSPHRLNTSSSPSSHPPSSSGQSTPYMSSSPFQSLQYSSPMATSPYPYPTQGYPPSPMYAGQYTAPPFNQPYTPPTTEVEPQGTWFYFPHSSQSPHQYDAGPYQGHHPVGYSQVGHSGAEIAHGTQGPSSIPSRSSPSSFPISPSQHYSDAHTPSDSPGPSGAGPPIYHSPGVIVTAAQSASSGSGRPPTSDKQVVRRSYHPNPPAHRSEWVMWAGNVPSDASHDELWRFFNQPPEQRADGASSKTGVLSIFLISRSSCAFINYENDVYLHQAITRFNGVPLRANDPRCARLVCRVRRKDDDLKAGVGGQRGMGMHTRWIRDQKGKAREVNSDPSELSASASDDPSTSPASVSERLTGAISNISMADHENRRERVHAKHSSSSGSYSSTNSSFLAMHFPKRYFILKSLTQEDLDLSVKRGVWATQKHNEEILDQAYRSSKEVHLIFSVNKSGEFYGHARMSGPVRRGESRIPWASRPPQAPARSVPTQSLSTTPLKNIFSPSDNRFVDESPLQIDGAANTPGVPPSRTRNMPPSNLRHSAPALLGEGYKLPTVTTLDTMHSLDQPRYKQEDGFELDPNAPTRAMRANQGSSGSSAGSGSSDGQEKAGARSGGPSLRAVEEEEEERVEEHHFAEGYAGGHGQEDVGVGEGTENVMQEAAGGGGGEGREGQRGEEAWGDSFAVEWICTDRLPFHRVKHLRNPWNHDREIKISRDGTELEPTVGQRLLDEWEKLADPQLPPTMGAGKPAEGKRVASTKGPPAQAVDGGGRKEAPRSR